MSVVSLKPKAPLPAHQQPRADWNNIEADYKAGRGTIKEIAARYSVSGARISQVAKKRHWEYGSLSETIRAGAELSALLPDDLPDDTTQEEKERIATNNAVDEAARIVKKHKTEIESLRDLSSAAMKSMRRLLTKPADQWTDNDKILIGKMQGTVDGLDKLSAAMLKFTTMERQAFGLDTEKGKNTPDAIRERVEAAKRELARRGISLRTVNGRLVADSGTRQSTPDGGKRRA